MTEMDPIWEGKYKYSAWAKGKFGVGCEEAFGGSMSCVNENGYGSAGGISIAMDVIDALMKEVGISKFDPRKFRIYIEEIGGDEGE